MVGEIYTIMSNTPTTEAIINLTSSIEERVSYIGSTRTTRYLGYAFDQRSSSLSGPFVNEDVTAVTTKDNSAEMFCVNTDMEVKKTDLLDYNSPNLPPNTSDPFDDLGTSHHEMLQYFDAEVQKGVVCSETGEGFAYRGRYMSAPFEPSVAGGGEVKNPLYFREGYLSVAETNWLHLGDEHSEKQYYRTDLSFLKNSYGYLWLFVKNENGQTKGQFKGKIKDHMKVFTNLRGRCFRIQMIIAGHPQLPWALREMAIGHLYGKSF